MLFLFVCQSDYTICVYLLAKFCAVASFKDLGFLITIYVSVLNLRFAVIIGLMSPLRKWTYITLGFDILHKLLIRTIQT